MNFIKNGPESGPVCLFAHGAGAPMDSDFMETVACLLAEKGVHVIRFEFPYMQERRVSGKKRPPNRQPELLECLEQVITEINRPCVLMGKSMGGRMASILAAQDGASKLIKGVLALGYPFHPAGKPEKLRVDHLPNLNSPMAIVQGTRDALGNQETVESLDLPSDLHINWLEDGDHDLKPRVKSGFKHEEHIQAAVDIAAMFIEQRLNNS